MARHGLIWTAGRLVDAAQPVQGLELPVAVADRAGAVEGQPVGVAGEAVSVPETVNVAEAAQGLPLAGAVADDAGDLQGLREAFLGRGVSVLSQVDVAEAA